MIWFFIIGTTYYLITFFITRLFVNKNKFIYFSIINWSVFTIIGLISIFFVNKIENNEILDGYIRDIIFVINTELMVEPTHHILLVIALVMSFINKPLYWKKKDKH